VQALVKTVHVSDPVKDYIVTIVDATRQHAALAYGGSPRASLALMRVSQSLAAFNGRNYVLPRDVRDLAPAVLSHRLPVKLQARAEWEGAEQVVHAILDQLPMEKWESGVNALDPSDSDRLAVLLTGFGWLFVAAVNRMFFSFLFACCALALSGASLVCALLSLRGLAVRRGRSVTPSRARPWPCPWSSSIGSTAAGSPWPSSSTALCARRASVTPVAALGQPRSAW